MTGCHARPGDLRIRAANWLTLFRWRLGAAFRETRADLATLNAILISELRACRSAITRPDRAVSPVAARGTAPASEAPPPAGAVPPDSHPYPQRWRKQPWDTAPFPAVCVETEPVDEAEVWINPRVVPSWYERYEAWRDGRRPT